MLHANELVVADKAYIDIKAITPYTAKNKVHKRQMALARARHENVNGKFKEWQILAQCYRHDINKHHIPARAVFVLTQIAFDEGRKCFEVGRVYDPIIC